MNVNFNQLLKRAWYRSRFYMDVPMVRQLLQFRTLRNEFYSDLWRAAAANIGARASDWAEGFIRIDRDGLTTMVRQGDVMLDDHLLLEIMGNKALTLSMMREKGYETPRALTFTMDTIDRVEKFFETVDGPVVVKPVSGTGGGRGVTTGISDMRALRAAARLAARFDEKLLVEEQVAGASYRLLYLDGQFIDAVRRNPPVITGNGKDRIRDLVEHENAKRLNGRPITALSPLRIDQDCINTLAAQGFKPRTVLKAGQRIVLKSTVNENDASGNHTVIHHVNPEIVALGTRLVQDLGVRFAGVDLICRDIRAPLTRGNGVINEINTTPGIHHHYLVAEPVRRVPVAEYLLEYMFKHRIGVMELSRYGPEFHPGAEQVSTYPYAEPAARYMKAAE